MNAELQSEQMKKVLSSVEQITAGCWSDIAALIDTKEYAKNDYFAKEGDIFAYLIADDSLKSLHIIPPGHDLTGLSFCTPSSELYYCAGPFGRKKDLYKVNIDYTKCEIRDKAVAICTTPTEDIHCMIFPNGRKIAYIVRQVERHLYQGDLDQEGLLTGDLRKITQKSMYNYSTG